MEINPGDTMAQAKAFYKYLRQHGTEGLLNLQNNGWTIEPNFHFGYFAKGFGHGPATTLSIEDYLKYWVAPSSTISQLLPDSEGFKAPLLPFAVDGLMSESDIEEVCLKARKLGAINLNVIPGVTIEYQWSLADAVPKDKNGGMVNEVRSKVVEALASFGAELSEPLPVAGAQL